ncbi:MAG: hypothetical protein ACKOFI_12780, partial [Phycisphaerales bacterium]
VPFEGTTPQDVMQKHLKEQPVPPVQVAESLSGGRSMIIEWMLGKDPRERYHSTDHLIEDLDLVAAGESPVHARPKLDAPGGGVASIEGPPDSDLQIAAGPGRGRVAGTVGSAPPARAGHRGGSCRKSPPSRSRPSCPRFARGTSSTSPASFRCATAR